MRCFYPIDTMPISVVYPRFSVEEFLKCRRYLFFIRGGLAPLYAVSMLTLPPQLIVRLLDEIETNAINLLATR